MATRAADLAVYVPSSLGPLLRRSRGGASSRVAEGAVLFCDVSGFTPMTEALSVLGREGAEELTRVLNAYFTRMIGIIGSEGGDVLRFGGDAMTVLFEEPCGTRPFRAALAMMEAMGEFAAIPTRAGTFVLSMKIGAAHGRVLLGLLGDETSSRDYYAAGDPLDEAADAEHHAAPGLVVLHRTALEHAAALTMDPLTEGYGRLTGVREGPLPPLSSPPPIPAESLRAFVPPWLAERAGGGTLGEHRGTAVVFLSLAGFDWTDPGVQGRIDRTFRVLAGAARRYGGVLNKVDMGDKGAKGILLFGAPYAMERKEEMAVRAALECLRSPDLPEGLTLKAGVTSAPLFSGPVGAPSRREFTVMGDGINLAARLMGAAAPGQILVSRPVRETASGLVFEGLGSIRVKGKAEPVEIFQPSGERSGHEGAAGEELFGRAAAFETLRAHLFAESNRPLALLGGPGIGKTALARWAYREARVRQVPAAFVPLAPFSSEIPFSAWRGVVRQTLGLKRGDPPEAARAARDRGLSAEEAGFRPALNPLLDLPDEESPSLKGLSPKERKDLAFALVERLLIRGGERVILLDGLQWADPLSLELLDSLLAAPGERPWHVAAFSRERLAALQHDRWGLFEIEPLTEADTRSLLTERHGLREVPDAVLGWFQQRARGNPGTLGALVESLSNAGLLIPGPGGRPRVDEDRLFKTVFPDTLEGLYLQEVDHLPADARRALQDASTLGYSVSYNLLQRSTGLAPPELERALEILQSKGLLRDDTRGERPYLAFAAPLLRDAVYAAVPFAQRREVHAAALAHLESQGLGERPAAWPSLAHHAEAADDPERARRYHRLAGRDAQRRYDNTSALRHLEYVCRELGDDPETVTDSFLLADTFTALGKSQERGELIQRLAAGEKRFTPSQRGRLRFFQAQSQWSQQQWEQAEATLKEGLRDYESAGDSEGVGKTLVNLAGGVYGPTGRLDEAQRCLESAIALSGSQLRYAVHIITACNNMGVILKHRGDFAGALHQFQRALRGARTAGLPQQQTLAAGNLCGLLYEMGQFDKARKFGLLGQSVAHTFALRGLGVQIQCNALLAAAAAGRFDRAQEEARDLALVAESLGARFWQGLAVELYAQACAMGLKVEEALQALGRSRGIYHDLGEERNELSALAEETKLLQSLGLSEEARDRLDRSGGAEELARRSAECGLPPVFDAIALSGRESVYRCDSPDALFEAWCRPEAYRRDLVWQSVQRVGTSVRANFEQRVKWAFAGMHDGIVSPFGPPQRLAQSDFPGIWGLRLLAERYRRESQAGGESRARPLRRRGLRHLYSFVSWNPPGRVAPLFAHEEIRSLLRGSLGPETPPPQ